MQSLGKVTRDGLLDPDREMELELLDNDVGERESVTRTVHGIIGNWKQRGMCMIQCIEPNQYLGWDLYYANGLRCY